MWFIYNIWINIILRRLDRYAMVSNHSGRLWDWAFYVLYSGIFFFYSCFVLVWFFCLTSIPQYQKAVRILYLVNKILFDRFSSLKVMHLEAHPVEGGSRRYLFIKLLGVFCTRKGGSPGYKLFGLVQLHHTVSTYREGSLSCILLLCN